MAVEIIRVPDLGGAEEVEVIEIPVSVGDQIAFDDTIVVLESEKATMELPAPCAGKVLKILVAIGDKITAEGVPLMEVEAVAGGEVAASAASPSTEASSELSSEPSPNQSSKASTSGSQAEPKTAPPVALQPLAVPVEASSAGESPAGESKATIASSITSAKEMSEVYAGPYVRRLARELGVDLTQVQGSGPRQRVLKEDVQKFVKQKVESAGGVNGGAGGSAIPAVPDIDHARFGEVDTLAMSKIAKLTAANMHRSWLNVPHVTQFDDADITDLETFRKSLKAEVEQRGVKISPVPFLLKACALALQENPVLNRSLHSDGEHVIQKNYYHIGMAVDTPKGLMVPVIRDVNKKGIWELAAEITELANKARSGKLTVNDMQGGCFTVSSLGAIGGRGFTPIVNTPEVAILGVSKAAIQPVWDGSEFAPRKLLPLSLSYDHRAVNGGDAGRFLTQLVALLSDIRGLVM